jgi:hypothetical protein
VADGVLYVGDSENHRIRALLGVVGRRQQGNQA